MDGTERLLGLALDLVGEADRKGIPLRLLGGLAVRARCPSSRLPPFLRSSSDADFAASAAPDAVEALFAAAGWTGDAEFNLYNGRSRMIFRLPEGAAYGGPGSAPAKADVFTGGFSMCHAIPLGGRLALDPASLPLAELLLTKLQVFEANAKDLSDAACLLADHEPGAGDGESLNADRIAALCAADWGLWRTATMNLGKVAAWVEGSGASAPVGGLVRTRVAALLSRIEAEPKPLAWRLRAKAGDRIRWYELPEEVEA